MQENNSAKIKITALIVALVASATFSYYKFQTFQLKGYSSSLGKQDTKKTSKAPAELPTPQDAKEISSNTNPSGGQVVLESTNDAESTYTFYKNILLGKDWIIRGDVKTAEGYITKYKKDNDGVTVSITKDQTSDKTIISIEYAID